MDGQLEPTAPAEAPLGFLAARVDEKGRLKVPAAILQYLGSIKESRVFVTTFDKATVRIYPIKAWRETENFLTKPGEGATARAALRVRAKHYGADSEIDGQGRVLVPTDLRRELELEGAPVHLECVNQHFEMMSDSAYKNKLEESDRILEEKLSEVIEMGLP
jgi:MraZ protein